MSCLLEEVGVIKDIYELLHWLCPHLLEKEISESSKDWNVWEKSANDEFGINQRKTEASSKDLENIPWIEECKVAISPVMDIMAIACRNRLAFFTGRWERLSKTVKKDFFTSNWRGVVGQDENDEVTCLMCLPIISQKQSSSGAPDWTCVIVGFSSGFVSFYTENGLLLLSQIFEERSVCQLHCRTYIPANFGSSVYSDLTEEFVILYPKSVVSIDGFSLLQTLKACRSQAAKAAASGEECQPKKVSLDYKKFSLNDQEMVTNCTASGILPPHLYDKVIHESATKGFNTVMTSGVGSATQILTVGRAPFFAILGIKEGSVQPFIADIAMHYASKLKDAIFHAATGWLLGSKRHLPDHSAANSKPKHKIEQATVVPFRYTLPDQRRVGTSIALSLSRRLAAVTDEFGRVSVIDVQKSHVIRMLKGYRDAECGWIIVSGEWNNKDREVLFLVVHAPKRNILEVWLPQQGPRVAAFNVKKDARLIYTSHTYLGACTQVGRGFQSMATVLLNRTGTMERLSVPFHLALSGKTSKQAKDLHLFKTLKSSLRLETEEQVLKILKEVQTTNVKLQAVSHVISSRHVTLSLVEGILKLYQDTEQDKTRQEDMDHEKRILTQQLTRLVQLNQLYKSLSSTFAVHDHLPESQVTQTISRRLFMSENEASLFQELLHDKDFQPPRKRVNFSEERMSYSQFLHCWDVTTFYRETSSVVSVHLNKKVLDERKVSLAYLLYNWTPHQSLCEIWTKAIIESGLRPVEMLQLAFLFWVDRSPITAVGALHMANLMLSLAVLDQSMNIAHSSRLSPYWEKVRAQISEWPRPLHTLVIAYICRGIESSFLMFSNAQNQNDEELDCSCPYKVLCQINVLLEKYDHSHEYEELSLEMVEWKLLMNRCSKLLSLQKLYFAVSSTGAKIHRDYSVRVAITKGKGHVSELVAKWLIELEVEPERLMVLIKQLNARKEEEEEEEKDETPSAVDPNPQEISSSQTTDLDQKLIKIGELLKCVHESFPHSMVEDVLKLNLAWEFGASWKKNPAQSHQLEAAVFFLISIDNCYCKHGIGCLLWETLVQGYVQGCVKIMERLRGPPTQVYNSPELVVSRLPKVFQAVRDLLECIIHSEAQISYKATNRLTLETDDFWRDIRGTLPLTEVAIGQQVTSSDLTYIHHQLMCVLSLIIAHGVSSFRPVSLFPERDRASFFKPLTTSWKITSDEARQVVNSHQLNFLNRVITCIVVELPDFNEENPRVYEPTGVADCIRLGRSWGVAVDALRRHYICELYYSGLDLMAEHGLLKVNDGTMMGTQMLHIGGQRLRYLITSHPHALLIIPMVTPFVKDWCMKLDSSCLRCPDAHIASTVSMVCRATNFFQETSSDRQKGERLLKALQLIQRSEILDKQ